jgi:hypothetical protein
MSDGAARSAIPQVDAAHYNWSSYHGNKGRFVSYWHQIDEVLALSPQTCMEIGVGSGLVRTTLRQFGVRVTCVDLDAGLGVDRTGDVRALPARDDEFDVVLCSQVLEHIPWADVPQAVSEIRRVCSGHAVISVPQSGHSLRLLLEMPRVAVDRAVRLPARRPHRWDGQHYWQVGAHGARKSDVMQALRADGGFELVKTYAPHDYLYHRFFVLRKLR